MFCLRVIWGSSRGACLPLCVTCLALYSSRLMRCLVFSACFGGMHRACDRDGGVHLRWIRWLFGFAWDMLVCPHGDVEIFIFPRLIRRFVNFATSCRPIVAPCDA
mmetsp:Transcript_139358/g.444820  ORF Transcript_139358/g.444820 Transcript_139358/m.444820 type:complete len:105 (-) Transcript_139358:69-383(-)